MDFSFSEEQELLRKTARNLFRDHCPTSLVREMEEDPRGYDSELWRRMAALDWMGLPFSTQYGGADGSFLDLAVLLEEVGRAMAPVPFFSSVVLGGLPLARFGTESQRQEILPLMASGEAILSFALLEPHASYRPQGIRAAAEAVDGGYRLTGEKAFVENAHLATHILCPARTSPGSSGSDGITVFILDAGASGLSMEPLKPISLERQWDLSLRDVFVPESRVLGQVGQGWPIIERTLQWAVAGQCAQAVGGAQAVLEMSVEYAKFRVQFQRPIGTFQAVQHHAANMYSDVETMRLIAYELAWLLSEDRPCAEEVAMAKTWVSTAYTRMTRTGIQIHGGIGLSKDTDPQLYFRRAKAWEPLFGGPDDHRAELADAIRAGTA